MLCEMLPALSPTCLSVSVCVTAYICLFVCLSVCVYVSVCVTAYICLSVCLSVCLLHSTDESLTSCAEFTVQKVSPRTSDPVRRTLCLTETCLVERDPATYNVVTCKPLCDVRISLSVSQHRHIFNEVSHSAKARIVIMACLSVSVGLYKK